MRALHVACRNCQCIPATASVLVLHLPLACRIEAALCCVSASAARQLVKAPILRQTIALAVGLDLRAGHDLLKACRRRNVALA